MFITQAYKYTENNVILFFPESQKIILEGDTPFIAQGELVDVICEVEGDYTTMYEPSTAQVRIDYLQSEYDYNNDESALQKINQVTNLL